MNWLTIDPGISGTGWALFSGKKLIKWGTIRGKGITFQLKAQYICEYIIEKKPEDDKKIFCEWPSFQTAIGVNTQSINKLCFLIGKLDSVFPYDEFILIPVTTWKGQLSKEVTQKRAEKFFGRKGFNSHASDAVGIGQYIIENNLIY